MQRGLPRRTPKSLVKSPQIRRMRQHYFEFASVIVQRQLDALGWTDVALDPVLRGNQSIAGEKITAFEISSLRLQVRRQYLIYGLSFNIQRKPSMPQKD